MLWQDPAQPHARQRCVECAGEHNESDNGGVHNDSPFYFCFLLMSQDVSESMFSDQGILDGLDRR